MSVNVETKWESGRFNVNNVRLLRASGYRDRVERARFAYDRPLHGVFSPGGIRDGRRES